MKTSQVFKRVFTNPTALIYFFLVIISCAAAMILSKVGLEKSTQTIVQLVCAVISLFSVQRFGRIVYLIQKEMENER